MTQLDDLKGQRFTRLVVLRRSTKRGRGTHWYCRCDCGSIRVVTRANLKSGNTKSCGCMNPHGVRSLKHGATVDGKRDLSYRIWSEMIRRCHNPKAPAYKDYGARGITVCDRWRYSYAAFIADMGKPSTGMTLERKRNAEGYRPDNCVWATRQAQANNRRSNHLLEYDGRRQTIAQWARELGISARTLSRRLTRGWTPEEALETPTQNNHTVIVNR